MFGILIELYPRDLNGARRRPIFHGEIFETIEAASEVVNNFRRQNLPCRKTWIVEFDKPVGIAEG